MNNLQTYTQNLPDTIEDLTQFVLVGKAKLDAYMIKLRTVNKLSTAQEIRDQTLQETQELSAALIAAEQRIGEILLAIPKATPNNNQFHENPDGWKLAKTKAKVTSEMGYSRHEVSDYQRMAQNPEIVDRVISEAIENGKVVTKTQVMKEIRAVKEEARRKIEELERREPEVVTREVVPEDYREVKSKAKAYDAETNRLNQKISDMAKERNKLEDQIRELQIQTVQEQSKNSLLADCVYFVSRCGFFINDVAGYVWLADKLADLPAKEREQYVRAASAVRDWAVALLQSVERDKEYGEPEIQKLIEESAGKPADS